MSGETRQHELEIEMNATPERVWQALSTAEGIASWFAPVTRVEPGVGGSVFVQWGGGVEGSQRIEAWEPERHLRLANDRAEGAPPSVVDYFLEGKGGSTVLRLVHSSFGPRASFDDEYEATGSAWPVFLRMMKRSVELGSGWCRKATVFRILDCSREECWDTLMGPRGLGTGQAIAHAVPGGAVAARGASGESLHARGFSGNPPVLPAMPVYTTVFSGPGGWVTARLARRSDRRNVRILAGIQFVMTLAARDFRSKS
jgi:uncharacterized protein YndB with AHSA1/START domain